MSHDLDTRARRAATNLNTAVSDAELKSVAPGTPKPRRPLVAVLRPAVLVALLAIGSAVGMAVVLDSSPASTTVPPAPTTTIVPPSTVATEPTPPATIAVVPVPVPVPVATTTTVVADVEPPPLTITSPEDGAHLDETTVTFAGTTEPEARVFAGKYEADVDSTGKWQIVLIIGEGSTVARFVARDQAGNESHASVTVYYVMPTTTTTIVEKEKEIAEFTAHSTFGSCSETPPYDVYYGTGEPGSLVQVTSEFGSGSVEVGEEGNWEVKVFFEEAPPAEGFLVTVSDEFGRKAKFEFIYTP